jgi:hypothetical protein
MTSKNDIISKLQELKPRLKQDYSVKRIGIFGSFANNEQGEESDIDILVELEKPIGWKFFSLEIYLEQVFGRKIDLVTKNSLKKQIKKDILKSVHYI